MILIRVRVLFVFLVVAISATGAAAQQPAEICAPLSYSKYSASQKASKVYRLDQIEGQTVYAPVSQKWDSGAGGICVAVFHRNDGKMVAGLASGNDGQFEVARLGPGRYLLVAAVDQLQEIVVPVQLAKAPAGKNARQRLVLHLRLKEDRRKSFVTVISNSALREELLQMLGQDQAIRNELIKAGVDSPQPLLATRMAAVDERNAARMKAIVRKYGWPVPEMVGVDGAEAAFLIVQHAEIAFQKQMLPLVINAFHTGKLAGPNYAFLLDRVLVREGKPQVYGTQARPFDQSKEPVLDPIADETNVDKRRAAVGLDPLAEYRKSLKRMYFPNEP